jgi:hypothetical protein
LPSVGISPLRRLFREEADDDHDEKHQNKRDGGTMKPADKKPERCQANHVHHAKGDTGKGSLDLASTLTIFAAAWPPASVMASVISEPSASMSTRMLRKASRCIRWASEGGGGLCSNDR